MASALRESRRSDQNKLARIQRATEQAFSSLPDAVAIVEPGGKVEVADRNGEKCLRLKPGKELLTLSYRWMGELFATALTTAQTVMLKGEKGPYPVFRGRRGALLPAGGHSDPWEWCPARRYRSRL